MPHLTTLTDEQLFDRAVDAIWAGAAGESRGGDDASYNTAMDFLAESNRRLIEAGHKEYCEAGVYSAAFEKATAEHSGRQPQEKTCTCGARR
jgi:hypothetical protein